MINLSIWVLLFPLLGFIILGLVGRTLSRSTILAIAWTACGVAFLFALINFLSMLGTPVAGRVNDAVYYTWVVSAIFRCLSVSCSTRSPRRCCWLLRASAS